MNLTRKYKIAKLINIPLTGIEAEVIEVINSYLTDLTEYTTYPNIWVTNYLMSNDRVLFQIDYNDNIIRFDATLITLLINFYKMKSVDAMSIITILTKPFITSPNKDIPLFGISSNYFKPVEESYEHYKKTQNIKAD